MGALVKVYRISTKYKLNFDNDCHRPRVGVVCHEAVGRLVGGVTPHLWGIGTAGKGWTDDEQAFFGFEHYIFGQMRDPRLTHLGGDVSDP